MKKFAVIGAGFVGLAVAFELSSLGEVTLFEAQGIGSGASGASAGLMHPYPGEHGRKSWKAEEGMEASQRLLKLSEKESGHKVANYSGILKNGECIGAGEDVEQLGPDCFLIRSGVTVFVDLYLQGLWKACQKEGVKLQLHRVETIEQLGEYDHVILTAGAGVKNFVESNSLKVNLVKGQALLCELQKPLERSVTAKHYQALSSDPLVCYIGSTYERDFTSAAPDLKTAIQLLKPSLPVVGVKAGVRVTNPAHYFPILEQLTPKTWVITAMGSRGLLYHAYFAALLKEKLL